MTKFASFGTAKRWLKMLLPLEGLEVRDTKDGFIWYDDDEAVYALYYEGTTFKAFDNESIVMCTTFRVIDHYPTFEGMLKWSGVLSLESP